MMPAGIYDVEKRPFANPWFAGILLLKVAVGAAIGSHFIRDLFSQFVHYAVTHPGTNPWDAFLAMGHVKAFPYHVGMLAVLAPFRALMLILPDPGWETATAADFIAIRMGLLAADIAIYWVLIRWFRDRVKGVLALYWASPIVFYIAYFHGQLDIIPVAMMVLSLHFLRSRDIAWSALIFGLCLGTKTTALLAMPFIFIHVFKSAGRARAVKWLWISCATAAALILPLSLSAGYRVLVLGAGEQLWLFKIGYEVPIIRSTVYFAVLALLVMFGRFLDYSKINFDLMMMYTGLALVIVVSLVPPMPGWFMWFQPALAYAVLVSGKKTGWKVLFLNAAFLLWFLVFAPTADLFDALRLIAPATADLGHPGALLASKGFPADLGNIALTLLIASELSIFYWMYSEGVRSNEIYAQARHPLTVGISGASGAGKDTLCAMIRGVMGEEKVVQLNGDDYHRWERGDPKYAVYTHLHAKSNRLHQQMDDVFMLAGGRAIKRSRYDHATGKFTPPETVDPKQVLLISGLHTLYIRELRNLLNLKIYLDPDSAVCAAWKTARDTAERSYTREEVLAQISSRAGDEEKFIKPQRKNADLVFSFRLRDAADAGKYAGTREESLLELSVTAGSSLDCNDLIERLERTPSLKLAIEYTGGDADPQTTMTVSGLIGAGEVFSIASSVIPNLHELAGLAAAWKPGLLGLQQLMTVMAISQALRRHELSLPAPVSQMPDAGNV